MFNINFRSDKIQDLKIRIINVLGNKAHPFYQWAKVNFGKNAIPKWNFHKIIISKEGKIADTFASITNPSSKRFINFIEDQIKN